MASQKKIQNPLHLLLFGGLVPPAGGFISKKCPFNGVTFKLVSFFGLFTE